uniref:Reverse transcriptase domain-containing protein n=1 Tax=Nicotiana tabacum TaxID=4097 RepID=A0A1S4BGU9_TOBAC|nr:PREDICTED: uncharacterized protein LOC107808123 [Nicotiana tabacum]
MLVPKVASATSIKEYRPIACCSTLYKLISKIITAKLKMVVDSIVGPAQVAFIEGRNILDNMIIAHKLVKGYTQKGVSPRCCIKVDIRKAYDSVEWPFLRMILLEFGIADKISISLLLERFTHFCEVSGLKDNMKKSALYIDGVPREFKEMILQEMKFTLGELPFKYLGVPLSSKKLSIQKWMPLIEKITARHNCWIAKFLSYSGRFQLIKSVTGSSQPSMRALIAWDTICMPMPAGELNVLDIYSWNKASICKLLWAITTNKDTLWIQWIHSFYIKDQNVMALDTPKQACWLIRKIFDTRDWFILKRPIDDLTKYYKQEKFSSK